MRLFYVEEAVFATKKELRGAVPIEKRHAGLTLRA
jgi:hypothetical protein